MQLFINMAVNFLCISLPTNQPQSLLTLQFQNNFSDFC